MLLIGHHKANHVCLIAGEWEGRRRQEACQIERKKRVKLLSETGPCVYSGNWMFHPIGWWRTNMRMHKPSFVHQVRYFSIKGNGSSTCLSRAWTDCKISLKQYLLHYDSQLNKHFRLQKYVQILNQGKCKMFLWYEMEHEAPPPLKSHIL